STAARWSATSCRVNSVTACSFSREASWTVSSTGRCSLWWKCNRTGGMLQWYSLTQVTRLTQRSSLTSSIFAESREHFGFRRERKCVRYRRAYLKTVPAMHAPARTSTFLSSRGRYVSKATKQAAEQNRQSDWSGHED